MQVKLIGIKQISYTSKRTGRPVSGTELHVLFQDEKVAGTAVAKLFIKSSVSLPELKLNDSYNILFDRYGNVDFVVALK